MAQEVSSSLLLTWLGSAAVQYSLTEREHRANPRITVPESFAAAVKLLGDGVLGTLQHMRCMLGSR